MGVSKISIPKPVPIPAQELKEELDCILGYWIKYTNAKEFDGFYGSVDENDSPDPLAPLGIVMYSRILWAFSATCLSFPASSLRTMADKAYQGIRSYFLDKDHGGVFWSVSPEGKPLDIRKQLYGQAFCIYGMSEYYKLTKHEEVLQDAIAIYSLIEKHGFDKSRNGYVEAFDRNWEETGELRLSAKDNNDRKTMNTHLHIVEAYANLYTVWPNNGLKKRVQNLLGLFDRYFIDKRTGHLRLFFDDDWISKSNLVSYGHDIEAAWLLSWCASVIEDKELKDHFDQLSVQITEAADEGMDEDGGLWYEFEPDENRMVREKHSWPQAEALLGYYQAWQQTGKERYRDRMLKTWRFIKEHISDTRSGEWFWGVYDDYSIIKKDKAGFWKCPYHNTRALLELLSKNNKSL